MSHREEHTGRSSRVDCGSSRNCRRTSADAGRERSRDRVDRQRELDGGGHLHDVSHQRSAIKDLECKLEQERRQNKDTIDELLRERDALQYRYKMKELRLQEVMLQFKQFKDNQAPTYQRLRQCFLEPSVNLIFEKMKAEVDENKKAKEEAMSDLHAWSFTSESQTGKRLVARCKKLLQENEEFGKMVTSGNVAKLNTEIAMQKRLVDEMQLNEKEYDALVLEMDEELDLLTCACKQLQNKLCETVRLSSSNKDVPMHKQDGKQPTRRAAPNDSSQHQIGRHASGLDSYKSGAIRQNVANIEHNGVLPSKQACKPCGTTSKHMRTAVQTTVPEQENTTVVRHPLSPSRRTTSAGNSRVPHNKDEVPLTNSKVPDPAPGDVGKPDNLQSVEQVKSAPAKPVKPSSNQGSPSDDHAARTKPRVAKPSTAVPSQKQVDGEKRRKPASNESLPALTQSNLAKNKRRAHRLSSEERPASKIQNLGSSKENQHFSADNQPRQENAVDSRRSPVTHSPPVVSRNHRAIEARRVTGSKNAKSSRPNWDMEHSLSPSRQRDGIRSSVNKTPSGANKSRMHGINASRKVDGRRSPAYRYGEPRRRRHSPARNYR